MTQELYNSVYNAVKAEAKWLYKDVSDDFIDSKAIGDIVRKMTMNMEEIMRDEPYKRHK
jgi:hypothetical protein